MPTNLSLGGLNATSRFLNEFSLPLIDDLSAEKVVQEVYALAVAQRKGFVVVGSKGTGKTIAAQRAHSIFERLEQKKAAEDAQYNPVLAIRVESPRSASPADLIGILYEKITGATLLLRERGRRRSESDLMRDLVEAIHSQHVGVIVLDEAEILSEECLLTLRDILSLAESRGKERLTGDRYKAAGTGMVLLGTEKFEERILKSDERYHRWVSFWSVDLLPTRIVPIIFQQLLPAFESAAKEMGEKAWSDLITRRVTSGSDYPLRFVENITRSYAHFLIRDAINSNLIWTKNGDIPWNPGVFTFVTEKGPQ